MSSAVSRLRDSVKVALSIFPAWDKYPRGISRDPVTRTEELVQMECVPCKGGVPTLTTKEIPKLKPQVPKWSVVTRQRIKRLERVFKFNDFAEPLAFTNKVGDMAESQRHHPAILMESGKVTIT